MIKIWIPIVWVYSKETGLHKLFVGQFIFFFLKFKKKY